MKPIGLDGYSHLYSIDEHGNVWSNRRGRYIKPAFNNYHYPMVYLTSDDRAYPSRWRMVHRLVMLTFGVDAPGVGYEINHKDHNKANCHISNLEWVTHSENILRAFRDGYRSAKDCGRRAGYRASLEAREKMSNAKLKPVRVTFGGSVYNFKSIDQLCRSDIFGFKMYRKLFNRVMGRGGSYKGWFFEFTSKDQVLMQDILVDEITNCEDSTVEKADKKNVNN
jgi:hypothetical protein